jgi:hypothetical protein
MSSCVADILGLVYTFPERFLSRQPFLGRFCDDRGWYAL